MYKVAILSGIGIGTSIILFSNHINNKIDKRLLHLDKRLDNCEKRLDIQLSKLNALDNRLKKL